jgi:hypothetical protein
VTREAANRLLGNKMASRKVDLLASVLYAFCKVHIRFL